MRFTLVITLFFSYFQLSGQQLIPDWIWQNGRPQRSKNTISGVSFAGGMGNIYGVNDLIYFVGGIRFAEQDSRIWSAKVNALPTPIFTELEVLFSVRQRLGNDLSLGGALQYHRSHFQEVGRSVARTALDVNFTKRSEPWTFTGNLQLEVPVENSTFREKVLSGHITALCNLSMSFLLGLRVDSPGPGTTTAANVEVMHSPGTDWSYSIAIGIPNPYFGFRIFWQIFPKWSIDLRSRRHPYLGFSHEGHFIFNMP